MTPPRLSPYWLWFLLSLPAAAMLLQLASTDGTSEDFADLLHVSGETSARALIVAMLASPLVLLLRGWRGPRWMMKNRRYFGVAAFGYAALHTLFYILDKGSFGAVVEEIPQFYIWTGWVAFLIFIPLAATSMDYAVRIMGRRWKTLQRSVYVAAVLTLLHWAAVHDWGGVGPALVHFVPLTVLEAYRLWFWYLRPGKDRKSACTDRAAFTRRKGPCIARYLT
ncbi:MAG: ferric reductase-like transmembrane domain-containing protein [Rhodobacteraceae bacterium]|nr:ferric reductase-like transmembrane domain-containing protein [Paracoccaceae bacterium]MCY4139081.1 ferric reductase-like transmembrane domain-containing protein [Paracoccaceae bacterium]